MGQITISKNHHKLILISLAILFIVMYVFIFRTKSSITTRISSPQSETMSNEYTSTFLKFRFLVPSEFEVRENGNTITLAEDNKHITITRLFSYFNSEKEYMDYTSTQNNYKYSMKKSDINNFFIVSSIVHPGSNPDEISYIKNIDTDTFVSISTSSPDLYDELDQIAASFEYLGDTKE